MDYKFKINDFEGPLDLLLHLIKESKMDIFNIEIVSLTNQYLDFISHMEELNLSIASSYLVMASELMYIKSNYLLPRPEKEDEDKIEIPGVPEGRAAKLADRTKGAVLEAGRYNAEAKISGVYENGTTVTYKITVTNN